MLQEKSSVQQIQEMAEVLSAAMATEKQPSSGPTINTETLLHQPSSTHTTAISDTPAVQTAFSDTVLILPSCPVQTTAQKTLSTLFETQKAQIEAYDDDHWKNPEFPLARIKKIMRIDEDVKMISGEVPILLSKAIEIFVTELTLRSWIFTEESKRRTVQRSDIAMAIAKNDMFDFLIDIVPREEIHTRTKTVRDTSTDQQQQPVNSELLQLYLQLLAQQNESQTSEGDTRGGEANTSVGSANSDSTQTLGSTSTTLQQTLATNAILQQQIQLIQQIAQLQQQLSKSTATKPPLPEIQHQTQQKTEVHPVSQSLSSVPSLPLSSSTGNHTNSSNERRKSLLDNISVQTQSSGNLLQTQTTSELSSFLSSNPLIQHPTHVSNPPASVSSPSITELSQLNGNNVQRFIIRPGGLVEGGGLSTLSQQSPIGLPSLVESSITHELNPASTGFSAGLSNTIGPSGIIFDDSSTDDTN